MLTQLIARTAVLAVLASGLASALASVVGAVTMAQASNPLIGASQASGIDSSVYLPIILNDLACAEFFDDFSNPASGWFVGEDNKLLAEYLGGEYRVLVKRTYSSYIFDAPACRRQDYTVQVAARWADTQSTGISYGLMVGKMENPSQLYFFEVEAETREFSITHYGQGGWEYIVESQPSPDYILPGANTNILMVIHDGTSYTAMVNGHTLHTWEDTTEPGDKGVGLIVLSHLEHGNADARFDNFRVTNMPK